MGSIVRLAALGVCIVLLPCLASAKPWGFLLSPDGKTKLALDGDEVIVGSGEKAGARLKGATISKRHAKLTRSDKGVVHVVGLGSRFGTLVAGTELKKGKKMQLFKQTKLTFGAETWTFSWGDRGDMIAPVESAKKAKVTKSKKPRRRVKKRR